MAQRKLRASLLLCIVACLVGCETSKHPKDTYDPVQLMADLHCEAVALRKARFDLADQMRFMEDTLLLPETSDSVKKAIQEKLALLQPYKDSVVTNSLDMAKIIKSKLDSIIEIELTEESQRADFDARLTAELAERGCK